MGMCSRPAGRCGDRPRQVPNMQTAASDESSLCHNPMSKTTARAGAAVTRAVLCQDSQDSASFSNSSHGSSFGSMDSGRHSPELSSQDSAEHSSGDLQSHSDSQQTKDSQGVPYNALQHNLLAQYKPESEESRLQAKGTEGTSVSFGRGQPLQALPEEASSALQVSGCQSCCHKHCCNSAAAQRSWLKVASCLCCSHVVLQATGTRVRTCCCGVAVRHAS